MLPPPAVTQGLRPGERWRAHTAERHARSTSATHTDSVFKTSTHVSCSTPGVLHAGGPWGSRPTTRFGGPASAPEALIELPVCDSCRSLDTDVFFPCRPSDAEPLTTRRPAIRPRIVCARGRASALRTGVTRLSPRRRFAGSRPAPRVSREGSARSPIRIAFRRRGPPSSGG
jgi:hypothetical protein